VHQLFCISQTTPFDTTPAILLLNTDLSRACAAKEGERRKSEPERTKEARL
jgi:hypothetical protein